MFASNRMDGSYFVGSTTALHPPSADTSKKLLPVAGATCAGSVFMQLGNKIGGSVQVPGMSSMFTFMTEQVIATHRGEDVCGCACS